MPNPSINNERVYRALRRRGYSKEQAARIANAQAHKAAALSDVGSLSWLAAAAFATFKHPGHSNQKIHGRRGGAGQAGQAAYQQARAGGASVSDARAQGRAATAAERGREQTERRAQRTDRLSAQAQRARAAANSGQVTEAQRARLHERADRLEARARGERVGPRKPAPPPKPAEAPKQEPKTFRTAQQADKHHAERTGIDAKNLSKAEDQAVRSYQGYGYETINGTLRSGRRGDADERRIVRDLDSAMERSRLTEPVTTYRGMVAPPGSHAASFIDGLRPGSTFTDSAYTSTTVDPKGVQRFLGNLGPQPRGTRQVQMTVRVPAGSRGIYMNRAAPPRGYTNFTKEYELLLARGGSYRVVSRSDKGTTTTIEVEYVPGP